ncbi:MAG: DUF1648 domain-containing protein [Gemmatimonadaceae bacterium]
MRDHTKIVSVVLVAAAFAIAAIAYPDLPPQVPTHWNLSGHADGFSSRLTGVLIAPIVMLVTWLFLVVLPRYDGSLFVKYSDRSSHSSTNRPVYGTIAIVVLALLLAIHVFTISTALGYIGSNRQPLLLAVIMSASCIVLGNYMPRVTQRNAFIGFRVPWAYASDDVWRRTQRAGGYGMVSSGVIGLIGAFAVPSMPLIAFAVATVAQLVIVMVYSYRIAHSRDAG